MKSYNLFIFLFLILISCSEESKKIDQTSTPAYDSEESVPKLSDKSPEVTAVNSDSIFSQNAGIIEWLNRNGAIRKGANLYSIDNSKSFELIYSEKKKCKQLIDSLIETCPNDLVTVLPKWQSFSRNLKLDSLTPAFPKIAFREEAAHFGNSEFVVTYNDLLKKERKMKSNFQLSKRDYSKIEWLTKRGQTVKKGQVIAIAYRKS